MGVWLSYIFKRRILQSTSALLTPGKTLLKLELLITRGELGAWFGLDGADGFQSFGAGDSGLSGRACIPDMSELDLV